MDKASGPLTNRQPPTALQLPSQGGRPITERKMQALFVVIFPSNQREKETCCMEDFRKRRFSCCLTYIYCICAWCSSPLSFTPLTFADSSCHGCEWLITDPLVEEPIHHSRAEACIQLKSWREVALQEPWPHPYNHPMRSSIERHSS